MAAGRGVYRRELNASMGRKVITLLDVHDDIVKTTSWLALLR